MSYLQQRVIDRCKELGPGAAEFFEVSPGLVKQWIAGSKTPSLAAVEKVFTLPEGPPTDAAWEGREVFIAIPMYKTTSPRTLFSLLGIWDRAKFRLGLEMENALIVDSRERLMHEFLQTQCPWVWWVDDDMVFPMGSAAWYNKYAEVQLPDRYASIHTPTQLRRHGKSIMSSVYFQRFERGRKAVYAEALQSDEAGRIENEFAHSGPHELVKPTVFTGMGCVMHSRQVALDIQAKFPHLGPEKAGDHFHFFSASSDALWQAMPEMRAKLLAASEEVKGGSAEKALALLTDTLAQMDSAQSRAKARSRLRAGEDFTFFTRAAEAGHQCFVDFSVYCSHLGTKAYNKNPS